MKIKKYIALIISIPFLVFSINISISPKTEAIDLIGGLNELNNIASEFNKTLNSEEGKRLLTGGFNADRCARRYFDNKNLCNPAEILEFVTDIGMSSLNIIDSYSENKDPDFINKADGFFNRLGEFAQTMEKENYQGRGAEIAALCQKAINSRNALQGLDCLRKAGETSGTALMQIGELLQDLINLFGLSEGDITENEESTSPIEPRMSFYKSTDKERSPLKVQSGGDSFTVNVYADIPKYPDIATIRSHLRYDDRYLDVVSTQRGLVDLQDSAFNDETPIVSSKASGQNSEIQVYEPNKNTIKSGTDLKLYSVKFKAKKGIKKNTNTELKFSDITIVSKDLTEGVPHESMKVTIIGDKNSTICKDGYYGTPPNCKKLKTNTGSKKKDKSTSDSNSDKSDSSSNSKNTNVESKAIIYTPPKANFEKPKNTSSSKKAGSTSNASSSNKNKTSSTGSDNKRYSYGSPYNYKNRTVYSNKNEPPIKGFTVQTEPDQYDKSSMPVQYGQSYSDDPNPDDDELESQTEEFALGGVQTKTLYDEFSIEWKTNRKATSVVEYGETIDDVSNEVAVNSSDGNKNNAIIKNLKPATKYYFSIKATEEGKDQPPKTYEGSFTTRGYPVKVLVRNNDKAIEEAIVAIEKNSGIKSNTNKDGAVFFELKDGKYTLVVSYNDQDYKKEIEVEQVDFPQGKTPSTQQYEVDLSSYPNSKNGDNIGVVLAIVFGIIFLIFLIALAVIFYIKKKKQEEQYSLNNELIDFNQVDINQPPTYPTPNYNQQQEQQPINQPQHQNNPNIPTPPPPPIKTNEDVPENEYFSDL